MQDKMIMGFWMERRPQFMRRMDIGNPTDVLRWPLGSIFIAEHGNKYKYIKSGFGYKWEFQKNLAGEIWDEG